MDKVELEDITIENIARKINEIIDCLNAMHEERIEKLKKERNLIEYGEYMTDKEVIKDMKIRLGIF